MSDHTVEPAEVEVAERPGTGAPEGANAPETPPAPPTPAEPPTPPEPSPEEARAEELKRALEREPFNKRIGILAAKNAAEATAREAAERDRDALRAEIQRLRSQPQQPGQPLTADQIEKTIEEQAERRAQQRIEQARQSEAETRLVTATNAMIQAGREKFGQQLFDAVSETVANLGATTNRDFLPALAELGEDHRADIIHYLGTHPGEMAHITGLSGAQMGVALAKLEARVSAAPAPKPLSKAPAPIAPLEGGVSESEPDIYSDDLPFSKFAEIREKQEERRRNRAYSGKR